GGGAPTSVVAWNEAATLSPAAISAGSTAAATWYAASSLTNVALRAIGFVGFSSGQVTGGVWATDHSLTQLFGPGVKKPGDEISRFYVSTAASTTSANVTKTATSISISP